MNANPALCGSDHDINRRRSQTALRMVPLECSCRDPWTCHCYREVLPLTDHVLDGWRDAAQQLLEHGVCPLMPASVARNLWARGGVDRDTIQKIHKAGGVR